MKKIILTMMVAMISLTSFAQFGGGQGQRREMKPEDQATRRADQIKEAAKISDEQYKKVYDLFLKQAKDMDAKMKEAQGNGGGGFGGFNMEDFQKQQEATDKSLKEILNEQQYAAYQKAQEEMRKRFQQGGGFGG